MDSKLQSDNDTKNSMSAAFSNDLIFSKILKYLELDDIKNCCQVCSQWNVAAYPRFLALTKITITFQRGEEIYETKRMTTAEMKASPKSRNLIILNYKDDEPLDDEDMVYIVELANHFGSNITNFQYSVQVHSSKEVNLFQNILSSFQNLKTLDLKLHLPLNNSDFYFTSDGFITRELQPLKTVKSLKLSVGCTYEAEIPKNNALNYATIVADFCRIFPHIQSLTLSNRSCIPTFAIFLQTLFSDDPFSDFMDLHLVGGQFPNLVGIKRNWILRKLKINDFRLKLPQYNILTGSKFITNLSSLSIVFNADEDEASGFQVAKSYERLLWIHAKTLTSLTLHNMLWEDEDEFFWRIVDVNLPRMPKLNTLKVVVNNNRPSKSTTFQYNFQFKRKCDTSGQVEPMSERKERFLYSNQFPVLRNFSIRVFYNETHRRSSRNARFEQMKIVLQTFVVNAELQQGPPAKSTTLTHFELIGVDDIELEEFGINFNAAFPYVYNPIKRNSGL